MCLSFRIDHFNKIAEIIKVFLMPHFILYWFVEGISSQEGMALLEIFNRYRLAVVWRLIYFVYHSTKQGPIFVLRCAIIYPENKVLVISVVNVINNFGISACKIFIATTRYSFVPYYTNRFLLSSTQRGECFMKQNDASRKYNSLHARKTKAHDNFFHIACKIYGSAILFISLYIPSIFFSGYLCACNV